MEFTKRVLTQEDIEQKSVLEVGSRNINGSVREYISSLKPKLYVGIDLVEGENVDIVMDAENLVEKFGEEVFDLVISTETLEHCKNWKLVISNIKRVLKPEGLLVITTRSRGFKKHDYPHDYWRFEIKDFIEIFLDFEICNLEKDRDALGVFIKAQKSVNYIEKSLENTEVYNINDT